MPSSSICGSVVRSRSASARSGGPGFRSEDRSGTVGDRAWVARRIHGESAAWAQGPAGGENLLRLLREVRHLPVAQPEPHRRLVALDRGGLAFLGGGSLARDEHEHLTRL